MSQKLFERNLPSGGFKNSHQQESPAQYFSFIKSLFKNLKIYVIVPTTQVTCNIYCIWFNGAYSNLWYCFGLPSIEIISSRLCRYPCSASNHIQASPSLALVFTVLYTATLGVALPLDIEVLP